MTQLNIRIKVLSPFRVIPWVEKGDKRKRDRNYIRGGSFAQWHRNADHTGRPYLTGTLLRSALFSEISELLARFDPFGCCNYVDHTNENISEPEFIKVNSVFSHHSDDIRLENQPCKECPLCHLLGRSDTVRRKKKIDPNNPDNTDHWTVHFSNLRESKQQKLRFEQIARKRIINRVDPYSGKAKDYMYIWEIDHNHCSTFEGSITLNLNKLSSQQAENVQLLICAGLSCVNILAGATCRVTVTNVNSRDIICRFFQNQIELPNFPATTNPHDSSEPIEMKLDSVASSIEDILVKKQYEPHLRRMADTIRDLRRFESHVIDQLPSKKTDGRESLWDLSLNKQSPSIRQHLKDAFKQNHEKANWRQFCETTGHLLYLKYKKREKENQTEYFRLLGETELFGRPMKKINVKNDLQPKNKKAQPNKYFFLAGQLTAKTPFFFGIESNQDQQTSAKILLTSSGNFRLPRSVIRGVLRRDLRQIIGDGCLAEVGGKPCDCKICRFMRCIIVEDAISECKVPPAIRYRIRLNPHTQTVETGALFDMETGYQGVSFPFRFHLRFAENDIPEAILNLLHCWKNEEAVFGGDTGVGMGRFQLVDYLAFYLDLSIIQDMAVYMMAHGFKGISDIEETMSDCADYLIDLDDKFDDLDDNDFVPLLWEKITYQLEIGSPLMSRDTIGALQDHTKDNADAIMIQKKILEIKDNAYQNKNVFFIKGESLRGLCRFILAKEDPISESICELDHEDCNCMQCRLFGSTHQQGKLRFEDAQIQKGLEKKVDHVAIDRFTGGGVDQMKFDEYPLAGTPEQTIKLNGQIWVHRHIDDIEKRSLKLILENFQQRIPTIGGLSAIGYGKIQSFTLSQKPGWLKLTPESEVTPPIKCSGRFTDFPQVQTDLKPDHIYYPHYFICPPKKDVKRIFATEMVSHTRKKDHNGNNLFSGTIHCTLTTKGPIFIADTENENYFNLQEMHKKHINLGFFRINGVPVLPGSSIRGMVSSVFETLTHSCFRVFDSKKYLTRRIIPEGQKEESDYKPGRVIFKNNQWYMQAMEEVRLPLYDNPSLNFEDKQLKSNLKEKYKNDKHYPSKLKSTIEFNKTISEAAKKNRAFLKKLSKSSKNQLKQIFKGEKAVPFFDTNVDKNPHSKYAILTPPGQKGYVKKGYLKISGPDMVNVSKNPETSKTFDEKWENKTIVDVMVEDLENMPVHNDLEIRASQKKDYIRPVLACVKGSVEYRMHKRFERIFIPINDEKEIYVPQKIVNQYNDIITDNKNNTESIPKIFQSNVGPLSDGDLVYFYKDSANIIQEIIPVRISRETDGKPMGKRLPEGKDNKPNESLLACTFECIEDCENCPNHCDSVSDYFKPHPKGLCPACHIFGTAFYKSRVSFGMAAPNKDIKWYIGKLAEKGGPLTLPLLERPRPTWSMPKKDSKIPGRKFYVHHPHSVENIKNKQPGKNLEDEIKITENNRTIEPLAEGNTFTFEIKFNHLRDWELGLLIYALELEDQLGHKLGMGKALGFGSVQISVENLSYNSQNQNVSNKQDLIKKGFQELNNQTDDYLNELRKILWLDIHNQSLVKYPELETPKNEEIPGYIKLKEENYNQSAILTKPWEKWWPKPKQK